MKKVRPVESWYLFYRGEKREDQKVKNVRPVQNWYCLYRREKRENPPLWDSFVNSASRHIVVQGTTDIRKLASMGNGRSDIASPPSKR